MLLATQHIDFSYPNGKEILKAINLQIEEGEIVSIVGLNGEGKSTLLKCLAGILPISNGQILLQEKKLPDPRQLLVPGHPDISLVTQQFEWDSYFSVERNISNQLHHLSYEERRLFVEELLDVFELEKVKNHLSKEISGGEQQRLSMACALAKEPLCLLLDEPFVHLDVQLHFKIGAWIRNLSQKRKMSVVITTHNGTEALDWSDSIYILRNGQISKKMTPQKAYYKPANWRDGLFFGELNSLYFDGKQKLFRPNEFSLKPKKQLVKIDVKWIKSGFKGFYYANYFKVKNGKTIVLYDSKELKNVTLIYV